MAEIKFEDYAEEYDDCMELLDQEIPEYSPPKQIKPRADDRRFADAISLFEDEEIFFDVKKEWLEAGMPEYISEDLTCVKEVRVQFGNMEDYERFLELIQCPHKSSYNIIWFPYKKREPRGADRYAEVICDANK